MNTAQRLELSLQIEETARAYCRKVYGDAYMENERSKAKLAVIRQAMVHGANLVIEMQDAAKLIVEPPVKVGIDDAPSNVYSIFRKREK